VLVGGASMPDLANLPLSLTPLAERQAVVLRDTDWREGVDAIVAALEHARGR
jgi:hypothetical protein